MFIEFIAKGFPQIAPWVPYEVSGDLPAGSLCFVNNLHGPAQLGREHEYPAILQDVATPRASGFAEPILGKEFLIASGSRGTGSSSSPSPSSPIRRRLGVSGEEQRIKIDRAFFLEWSERERASMGDPHLSKVAARIDGDQSSSLAGRCSCTATQAAARSSGCETGMRLNVSMVSTTSKSDCGSQEVVSSNCEECTLARWADDWPARGHVPAVF